MMKVCGYVELLKLLRAIHVVSSNLIFSVLMDTQ